MPLICKRSIYLKSTGIYIKQMLQLQAIQVITPTLFSPLVLLKYNLLPMIRKALYTNIPGLKPVFVINKILYHAGHRVDHQDLRVQS